MDIEITTLPNGLRIITDSVPHVDTVSLGVWVGVGSRYETPEINGVTHMLEHMLFKGTKKRTSYEISEQIENVGGYINAYTNREQTAYYIKILKEHVPLAVDIISDILQNSLIATSELEKERAVVLQEIGRRNDTPDDLIFEEAQAVAFSNQALGMSVLGPSEIVGVMPREVLANYVKENYVPARMVLAASGNLKHAEFVRIATDAFSKMASGKQGKRPEAKYNGGEYRADRKLEQLHLIFGMEGVGHHSDDLYVQSVFSTVLGGGMSSRLFQEIREKRGLVYTIQTFSSAFDETGLFGVYAGTGGNQATELIPVVCDELLKLADTLKDEEVNRARMQLKASLLMGLERTMARCESLASSMLTYGRPILPEEVLAKLEAVTAADVGRLAKQILQSKLTLAALGPTSAVEKFADIQKRLR